MFSYKKKEVCVRVYIDQTLKWSNKFNGLLTVIKINICSQNLWYLISTMAQQKVRDLAQSGVHSLTLSIVFVFILSFWICYGRDFPDSVSCRKKAIDKRNQIIQFLYTLFLGFDLFSAEDKTIPAQGHGLVKTDIAIMLPKGTYGRIAPRFALSLFAKWFTLLMLH